ncbi:SCY1-like protein 2 isoform X1 [Octopus bimaculoides]|uniref:SCY1-like protein 2 isoform X1 n=1 Tax=Octopus bimaculoides TaxID=37653 RepID=UPI00071C8EEB|nr:SCY1-like protein 2 isoform X1 [Octopus bimaculoides]|eukprot:XP_014768329.1 PREDICTED: SCY1-like protein 2 isoform X1 [Octopus bimaculoides]
MDMFNKLKTVVSNALPGNPLSRDFELLSQIASAGPGLLWKVYNGVKRTTKQEVAIFVFEKRLLERYSKRDRDIITDVLKRGVSQLTRLRHPRILSVLHPLEESRESLAFATEPIFASLANVVKYYQNLPAPLPKELEEHKLYEVEIKYGLLQLVEALAFLHNDVNMMHHNICPESIIVNKNGAWKLSGFEFCISSNNKSSQNFDFQEWEIDYPPISQPKLDYLAPEYSLTMTCSPASDMFSLGMLIYTVCNNGKSLYECNDELRQFKTNIDVLRHLTPSRLGCLSEEVREHVKLLLNTEPSVRPDANQLTKIPFFEDVGSMTLQYLDTLFQRDNLQKSKFFKGLPKIIAKLPKRVNQQRILPPLFSESVNPDMIPFVLPSILYIAEQSTEREYVTLIFPEIIPMFKLQKPVQILLIFLQNMTLLLSKTSSSDIKNHVLPMVYHALESNDPQIQELVLNIIPTFASLIEYTSLKNCIIPRIKKMCLATSSLSVRVGCLVCIGKLLEYMDKWCVLDEVIPLLPQIPSREPGVLMSILGILKVTFSHPKLGFTKEILATKIIPFLVPLCIENNLNLNQFSAYIAIVKEMISKVENEQKGKLEQLNSMQEEQKTIDISKVNVPDEKNLLPELISPSSSNTLSERNNSKMDKFISGYGLNSLLTASAKNQTVSPCLESPTEKLNSETTPSRIFNQPAKVSLSMEEKQRLAREQEQQSIYKKQSMLVPKANPDHEKSANCGSQSSSYHKPKDLTSTLLNNNLNQLQHSGPLNNSWSMAQSNMACSSFGASSLSGGGMPMQRTNPIVPLNQSKPAANKSVDLSAFDNLLSPSSSQVKPSLNQMAQKTSTTSGMKAGNMGFMPTSSSTSIAMMGNVGTMLNQPPAMIAHPQVMMNQGMRVSAPMVAPGFQGMALGNTNMTTVNHNQFSNASSGPQQLQNGFPSSNPAGNELDDLFG